MIWQEVHRAVRWRRKLMKEIESAASLEVTGSGRNAENNTDWDGFISEAMPCLPDLKRTAIWLTRNMEDAEDLVQETLFNAMRSFRHYRQGTNCRAWIMAIMYNLNAKRLGKMNRIKYVDDPDGTITMNLPYVAPPSEDVLDAYLLIGLRNMPSCFRTAVVMSDVYDYSYKEISIAMNVPIGTVMSRISRGRRYLRKELSGLL